MSTYEEELLTPTEPSHTLPYFAVNDMPEEHSQLHELFKYVADYAETKLADGPEKAQGLTKLLDARQYFIRAAK